MSTIELPALDGTVALGFLAGLGALRLVAEDAGLDDTRLSWSEDSLSALLHSNSLRSVDDLVAALHSIAGKLPADQYLPRVGLAIPPRGDAPDKLRVSAEEWRRMVAEWRSSASDVVALEAWLAGLVTDLTLDSAEGRRTTPVSLITRTPIAAPFARQTLWTMFDKATTRVKNDPDLIRQAFLGWIRESGYTGEYLDERALYDSADDPLGAGEERGVPGATWLALMSLPLLPVTGAPGRSATATLWQTGYRSRDAVMRWPLWRAPLEIEAVRVLLTHPALELSVDSSGSSYRPAHPDALACLSVFSIAAARRREIHLNTQKKRILTPVSITFASSD